MSELRAPDPTLSALEPVYLWVALIVDAVPVAHRATSDNVDVLVRPRAPLDCNPAGYTLTTMPSHHAAYIAVPCRTCFPDAPPPGHEPYETLDAKGYATTETRPTRHLAWQTAG